jgi:hypothetical protein
MRWHDRALCCLYALTSLWLAWTTVLEALHGPLWAASAYGASSLVPLIALVEQGELLDLRQAVRWYAARARQHRDAALIHDAVRGPRSGRPEAR